jgi:hypothetical protein
MDTTLGAMRLEIKWTIESQHGVLPIEIASFHDAMQVLEEYKQKAKDENENRKIIGYTILQTIENTDF